MHIVDWWIMGWLSDPDSDGIESEIQYYDALEDANLDHSPDAPDILNLLESD